MLSVFIFIVLNIDVEVHFLFIAVVKGLKVVSVEHFCAVNAEKIVCHFNIV